MEKILRKHHQSKNSSVEKTKQNNRPRRIPNSLEKAGITTSSSYTTPL